MKTLNRPMFRMGGPIKEGIMDGIEEPRRAYQDGAFGTSAYTEDDYKDFINRIFVKPPPSETTIPGMFRPDVKNFFQDGMVTDQYSYENLFKPTKTVIRDGKEVQVPASIFEASIFDYAGAGIPGEKSRRILTGGKTGFATALKEDILSKLPKMDTPKGGGAAFSEEEITESDIEDNPTYISKMQEGVLKRGTPDEKKQSETLKAKEEDFASGKYKSTSRDQPDSELLQKLGYDRAVKRGNYQLIEAIRRGLTEGGVQGALDAAFAAGAGDPYAEASKIRQAAALKEYESELEDRKYKERRKDKLEDTIEILKKKKELGVDRPESKSITEKTYEFLVEDLKMDPDEAKRVAIKEHRTINEAVIDVQKRSGLDAVTISVLDGAGGVFYGNEYKGKVSPDKEAVDGWYLDAEKDRFIEIKDGKIIDSSRQFEVAK